jgi:GH15 family glucan-1,4-alpha-glucosidase
MATPVDPVTMLGPYSEDISGTGEQLGDFPQAFSPLSLISAAVNLDRQLDHGRENLSRQHRPPDR